MRIDAFVEHRLVIEAGEHRNGWLGVERQPIELDGEHASERLEPVEDVRRSTQLSSGISLRSLKPET
jgi:hypothetical protein